jgi:N-methylhydantoinase B
MTVDPVSSEVITSYLNTSCDEGMEAARHVSASPIVYAVGDVQTGILLPDGQPVIGSRGGGGLAFRKAVATTLERCSDNPGINPGDMFVVNDPFIGPRHQPDVIILAPIHYEGELVAWTGTLSHHLDTGAMTPGGWIPGASEVYQEGYRLPPVKLVERGELRSDIFGAIMNMVRSADKVALDYKGQIASNNVIRRRFENLCDRYGVATVHAVLTENVRRTRSRLTQRLRDLPDGTFSQKVFLELNDGAERTLLRYTLTMVKRDDRLTFDFTGTSPQQAGPANATLINTEDYGIAFQLLFQVVPDADLNEGLRDVTELIAPPGTLVNPVPPAPVSAGVVLGGVAIQGCLCKLLDCSDDNRHGAGGLWRTIASLMVMMGGSNQFGELFTYSILDSDAHGCGARTYADGVDTGGDFLPTISLSNVEFHEVNNPLLFKYRRQATDTGGPGRYRGGVGLEELWRPYKTDRLDLTITAHGTEPPTSPGMGGGMPGALNRAFHVTGGAADRFETPRDGGAGARRLPAAVTGLRIGPDSGLYIGTYGGGGYGDPLERPAAAVAADVTAGLVSAGAALDVYGVVLARHGDCGAAADLEATRRHREEIRQDRLARSTKRRTGQPPTAEGPVLCHIGLYLEVAGSGPSVVRCRRCGYVYCDAAENHKEHAAIEETPLHEAQENLVDVPELVLRRYYCPGCATQFWVDLAERGDGIEFDVRLDVEALRQRSAEAKR